MTCKECTISLALMALVIASCGRVPEPATYTYSQQKKMQASEHWDVLAADLANQINNALIFSEHLTTPVYVRETCGSDDATCEAAHTSVFNEAFRDLLITNLVHLGVPTSAEPTPDSIIVHYKAQPIYHHADRKRTFQPGLLTSLAAGVLVLRDAPWELAFMAGAGGIDALNSAFNTMDSFEVLITTSLVSKSSYIYRNSSLYYINTEDSWHYNTTTRPSTIVLTDGNSPPTPRLPSSRPVAPPEPAAPAITPPEETGI